jgi:hypothetical protein
MFGSQILEVGIGMILIFLLASLILTAVRETIEAWMKTRATDLERAIAELLNDDGKTGPRENFYKHPLVTALFAGDPKLLDFSDKSFIGRATWMFRTGRNLPSYIPRETFALAVEDLLNKGAAGNRLLAAREALALGLGEDPARVRKGLEQLYDSAMDRAAGWYKRRTQWILFWLGLAIALALNINAFTIAQHLATNETARAQMIGLATQLQSERASAAEGSAATPAGQPAAANPQGAAAGGEGGDSSTDQGKAAPKAPATPPGGGDAQKALPAEAPDSNGGGTRAAAAEPSAEETARRLNSLVREVGLPMGWDEVQVQRIRQDLASRQGLGRWLEMLVLVLGYLSVAFAATLGAPFWFDLLGRFMVIRSTVKPTEKSRDETSKDGGTGGAQQPRAGDAGDADPRLPGRPIAGRSVEPPQPVIFG